MTRQALPRLSRAMPAACVLVVLTLTCPSRTNAADYRITVGDGTIDVTITGSEPVRAMLHWIDTAARAVTDASDWGLCPSKTYGPVSSMAYRKACLAEGTAACTGRTGGDEPTGAARSSGCSPTWRYAKGPASGEAFRMPWLRSAKPAGPQTEASA